MLNETALKQIFLDARSAKIFSDKPIEDGVLERLYNLANWAPSASNSCPLRIGFAVSPEAKAKLIEAAAAGNKQKVESAPATAIMAYDSRFYTHMAKLAPHMGQPSSFERMPEAAITKMAAENAMLQAGAFIIAARSLGLDCGPMAGFDKEMVDADFHDNSSWRALFLLNLGYSDGEGVHPRAARLDFDEACKIY